MTWWNDCLAETVRYNDILFMYLLICILLESRERILHLLSHLSNAFHSRAWVRSQELHLDGPCCWCRPEYSGHHLLSLSACASTRNWTRCTRCARQLIWDTDTPGSTLTALPNTYPTDSYLKTYIWTLTQPIIF